MSKSGNLYSKSEKMFGRPYEGTEDFVFVCYGNGEEKTVKPYIDFLQNKKNNINVFYCYENGADKIKENFIKNQMTKPNCVYAIFFITQKSAGEKLLNNCINYARARDVKFYPLFLEPDCVLRADAKADVNSIQFKLDDFKKKPKELKSFLLELITGEKTKEKSTIRALLFGNTNTATENYLGIEPYKGDGDFLFISYARKDAEKVIPIVKYLADKGVNLWYDKAIDDSDDWMRTLLEKIDTKNCKGILFFATACSYSSRNCDKELQQAFEKEKNMISVVFEDFKNLTSNVVTNNVAISTKFDVGEVYEKEFLKTVKKAFSSKLVRNLSGMEKPSTLFEYGVENIKNGYYDTAANHLENLRRYHQASFEYWWLNYIYTTRDFKALEMDSYTQSEKILAEIFKYTDNEQKAEVEKAVSDYKKYVKETVDVKVDNCIEAYKKKKCVLGTMVNETLKYYSDRYEIYWLKVLLETDYLKKTNEKDYDYSYVDLYYELARDFAPKDISNMIKEAYSKYKKVSEKTYDNQLNSKNEDSSFMSLIDDNAEKNREIKNEAVIIVLRDLICLCIYLACVADTIGFVIFAAILMYILSFVYIFLSPGVDDKVEAVIVSLLFGGCMLHLLISFAYEFIMIGNIIKKVKIKKEMDMVTQSRESLKKEKKGLEDTLKVISRLNDKII